ncbi:MAG: ATP-binding cassette domain-containing protein [Magnetococcales bacterium]|nr:ATP-binding cassette domain-containing protein [Magnetococcales bacterium]
MNNKLDGNVSNYQDKEILNRLYGYTRPYVRYWVVAVFFMIAASGLTSAQAYLIKPALDEIFIEKNELYFRYLPFVIITVFLLKGVTRFFYEYYLERVGNSMVRDFRQAIFDSLLRQSISFFHRHSTGELMSRILTDVALIQGAISSAAVGLIKDVFQVVGLVGLIFYLDWRLAIFCSGFLAVAFLPVVFFSHIHRRLNTQIQEKFGVLSSIMHDSLTGYQIIQAFAMEKYESSRFSLVLRELFRVQVSDIKAVKLSSSVMEFVGGIGIVAIIVYGGSRVMQGESSAGTFFSFLTALVMTYEPIKGITRINSMVQRGFSAASRVFWVLDYQPEIREATTAETLPVFCQEICFRGVEFRYPETEQPILREIDLTLKKGQILALVGYSGSGKSTLVNLLPRFMDPNKGSITIDGVDLKNVTLQSLRSQIAVVTQNTVLFDDTIRNNIAYGQPERPLEEIVEVAKQANALEFIEALPNGFDTMIGESGVRLSGGQRQRLAIARAFLKNAPILILDEATSSLDTISERAVQDAIDYLIKGRTVLVVAHRLTTVERADIIAVLDGGQIVEKGSHAELVALEGSVYGKLHRLQHNIP